MQSANRAAIEFSIKWQSPYANHNDRYFAGKIDFRRDIFPGNVGQHISALHTNESHKESFSAGEFVPSFKQKQIIEFKERQCEGNRGKNTVIPLLGRFYPQGYAWTALNCFPQNLNPFRIIKNDHGVLGADTNHPLSLYQLTLEAKLIEKLTFVKEFGGNFNDIAEMISTNGPGMQIPYPGSPTDFYPTYPFQRMNDADDSLFYSTPRLVNHLDSTAITKVESIYSKLLSSNSRILDLMSSWVSLLPSTLENVETTGLGLNEEELKANKQLTDLVVHDLNQKPVLPFKDNEFDAVICTASIEYLIQPIEIMVEVARVAKPGGIFVTTFSDRWFPGKEILPWSEMHPFERLGLVLDYYLKAERYENLHTESVRGNPRPLDDKYIGERATSDPIFAVWGSVRNDNGDIA